MFYLVFVVLLLVGGALTVLTVENLSIPVHLTFLSWMTPDLPVGLWMVAAFLLGALLLYMVSMVSAWRDRREINKLRRHVLEFEQQMSFIRQQTSRQEIRVPDVMTGSLLPNVATPISNGSLPVPKFR